MEWAIDRLISNWTRDKTRM